VENGFGTRELGAGAFKGSGNTLEVAVKEPVAVPIEEELFGRACWENGEHTPLL